MAKTAQLDTLLWTLPVQLTESSKMSDQDIINQALKILKSRLHKPDFFITEQDDARSYLKL